MYYTQKKTNFVFFSSGEYKEFLYEPNVSLNSNGSLHFKKITKDAQGHFLCEAKNTIGTGVSKVIFLKVNGKTILKIRFSLLFMFRSLLLLLLYAAQFTL